MAPGVAFRIERVTLPNALKNASAASRGLFRWKREDQ